jgi:3',5'-cyclic AMP phosphodiesterase CpdA
MLIAQITDLHLGFDPDNPVEFNRKRLDAVLKVLIEGPNRPDLLLVSGDLTDQGDERSYRRCANAFGACPFPVYPAMGNHDVRSVFARRFPDVPLVDGFVQYSLDLAGLRLIVIDTLEPGRHGGGFCDRRAAWLEARLAEDRGTPTVIVMHHPPLDVGIEWMATHDDEPWVARFAEAIAGHRQVRAILCGHLHRAIVAPWHGVTVTICPSTAPQVALDINPIDPEKPDHREMIVAEPPGYALHRWNGRELVTLFDTVENHVVLARFDEKLQPLVRALRAEWPVVS